MGQFSYQAYNPKGVTVRGEVEATDANEALKHLRARSLLPISVKAGATSSARHKRNSSTARALFGKVETAFLLQQLSALLRAGLRTNEALLALGELVVSATTKTEIERLSQSLSAGQSLSQALAAEPGTYPRFVVSLVAAGEASGGLTLSIGHAAQILEKSMQIRRRVVSAMIYPAILVLGGIASAVIVLTFVLPRFSAIFAQSKLELPFLTRALIALSDGLVSTGPFLAGGLAIALWAFHRWRQGDVGRLASDRWFLKLPMLGKSILQAELGRFCFAMNGLIAGGVPVVPALTAAADVVDNRALQQAIVTARDAVRQGKALIPSLKTQGIFPPLMIRILGVGEEAASLSDSFRELSRFFEQELDRRLQQFLVILTPVVTLLMGGFVALIIAAVLSAVLRINDLAL
jgi:general secretion pathway protein F